MARAIKEQVVVQPGGLIEIRRSDLPIGATAEVIVMIEETNGSHSNVKKFSDLFGSVRDCFGTSQAVDDFVRSERDEWSR